MKKTVSFLLALILLCCMAAPAYAADNEMLVTLTIDESLESYEVTIPPTITLDAAAFATDGGGKTNLNVTINKLSGASSKEFYVLFTSQNGFNLVNTEDSSKVIPYQCKAPNGASFNPDDFTAGKEYYYYTTTVSAMLSNGMPYNTSERPTIRWGYICRYGSDAYPGGGTYTDTWTFTFKFN